jgi:thioester reductase-like protein
MSSTASTTMSPLEAFYSNSTVLISGGNGFLGKVLIEKLLRCFDIAKIYLLMRAKNGEDVEGRMEKFLNETVSDDDNFRHDLQFCVIFCSCLQIFDYLRENNPTVLEKIIPIEVDYDAYNLGLVGEKINRIHTEVEVMWG